MDTKDINEKDTPQVLRERIPGTKVDTLKITGSNGKNYDAREETFTEKEIPNTHLVQIAPMFYYCTDNNKVLMIPFSVQFTIYEFLKQAATMSHNMEALMQDLQSKQKNTGKAEASGGSGVAEESHPQTDTSVPSEVIGDKEK